jgi:hypothetical protein
MPKKDKKKTEPVAKAVRFTGMNFEEIEAFVGGDIGKNALGQSVVATPDGALRFDLNDWIINCRGKFYTSKSLATGEWLRQIRPIQAEPAKPKGPDCC